MSRLILLALLLSMVSLAFSVKVGPNWQSYRNQTRDVEELCKHKDVECVTHAHSCLFDDYNPVHSCQIIAGFTNYSMGLQLTNPVKYTETMNRYPEYFDRNQATMGIFLFGKYYETNSTQSVGVVTHKDEIEKGGQLYTCSQGSIYNRSHIISSSWRYTGNNMTNVTYVDQWERLNVTSQLHSFGNASANVSLNKQEYFACSWALRLSEVQMTRDYKFNVSVVRVRIGSLIGGPIPIKQGQIKISKANSYTVRVSVASDGSVHYDTYFRGSSSTLSTSVILILLMMLFNKMM